MIEQHLEAKYPKWFGGRRSRITRPLLRGLRRLTRLDEVDRFLRRHPGLSGLAFVRAVLSDLDARYTLGGEPATSLPSSGAVVVVANHPVGALDALALLDAVGRVRTDVRVVANEILGALEGLRPLLLPVDVFGSRTRAAAVRAIDRALGRGECVVLFPAGEVAGFGLRGPREGRWRDSFVRFARRHGAPVVPVRVDARNSGLFYGTRAVAPSAATWLLAREMFARRQRPIRLTFGSPVSVEAGAPRRLADELRSRVVAARGLQPHVTHRDPDGAPAPLPAPLAAETLRPHVEALELLGRSFDGKEIRIGRLAPQDPLMLEIGLQRERTFRAVGEGTGRARDIDRFDTIYHQIVLWDAQAGRLVGGYRVAEVANVLADHGLRGLYTASLFAFDGSAVARLPAGVEVGRSFVVPEYWGSRSIDYLWQGIGAYLARVPWVRYLFGAVSISAALPDAARHDVVAFYSHWHGASAGVRALRPYAPPMGTERGADAESDFRAMRERLARIGASVPMLYKQYVDLCEPGGARFLAFGTDPDFSDVVDGFVEVDLARLRPHKRERYLGTGVAETCIGSMREAAATAT